MGLGLNVKITTPVIWQNNGFTSYNEVELVELKGIEGDVSNDITFLFVLNSSVLGSSAQV